MRLKTISLNKNFYKAVDNSISVLTKGGILVYPTDTAYGLGVNALNINAIKNLYLIKQRDLEKPTHIVVKDLKMLKKFAYTNKRLDLLLTKIFPGPFTAILNRKNTLPKLLNKTNKTIGIRIPDHKFTSELFKRIDFPITTPSANIQGGVTPYKLSDTKKSLPNEKIDLYIDGGFIKSSKPSTIIDFSGNELKIIRPGRKYKYIKKLIEDINFR